MTTPADRPARDVETPECSDCGHMMVVDDRFSGPYCVNPTCFNRAPTQETGDEPKYAQGSHLFNHEHLWHAYTTGANDATKHNGHITDELIARSADAYVKSVAPAASPLVAPTETSA